MQPQKNDGTISNVVSLSEKREAKLSQVYSCGKCDEQAALLFGDNSIRCGRKEPEPCLAQYAADWFEPTGAKLVMATTRPRTKQGPDGMIQYRCGECNFPFFHVHSDGSLSCYRQTCKRVALFRWKWHRTVTSKEKKHKGKRRG